MDRAAVVQRRAGRLMESFALFLGAFDRNPPFSQEQLKVHSLAIDMRRRLGSVEAALADDRFLRLLRAVLIAWGIGARGSVLADEQVFIAELRESADALAELETITIDGNDQEVVMALDGLSRLIENLAIVENRARLVAVSKALHHLPPELIPPMDREYTGSFFGWHGREFQDYQVRLFRTGLQMFHRIAITVNPSQFVGRGWQTTRTKVLDNAVVGFCIHERLPRPS